MNPSRARTTRAKMTRMRLAALLLPVALLTGCASTQAAATPAPAATSTLQADYVKVMRTIYPSETEASITALAKQVCTALDKGLTPAQLAPILVGGEVNEAGARIILRGSVAAYCPKHADIVPPQ